MKYIEPILIVCGDNERTTLHRVPYKDFDILIPYEYQRKHIELLNNYIAPDYYDMCPVGNDLAETVRLINKSPYHDYFKYFFVKFRMEIGGNVKDFKKWLENSKNSIYLRKHKFDVKRYYELTRYYNTIIIDLELGNNNKWNRFWNFPPSFYNNDTLNEILDFLTEGGKLIFINGESHRSQIFDITRKGYEEIDEFTFIKNKTPKTKFKEPRMWL